MKKIISFDIWDTIIKRKCHPEEIKLNTAKYIILKYGDDLKDKYKDIYEILKIRDEIETRECEKNKNNGFDDECRIIDVFDKLQNEIFNRKKDIKEELLKEEIEQEKRCTYINPDILPIFEEYRDLEMYCISDFYMSADSLKEILDYLRLPVKIQKIYSSADYLLNKKTGNLYKKVHEELNIKPEEHIHVGDNEYSDISIANNLGIQTIKATKTDFDFVPSKERKMNIDLSKIKKDDSTEKNRLFNCGVDLAPLLYFFGYSVIEYAIKNGIDKVYYQTREGETFIKIHEIIKKSNPFGVTIPECDIIEVSRMGTFSASLNEFSINELLRLWSQYQTQSMKTLFKTLAIDIEPYKMYTKKYNINPDEDIVEPWKDSNVKKMFSDKEFTDKVNGELKRKKNELLQYFKIKKEITNDDKSLFIVDIGWRGTIQDNLCYIFNNKKINGYYLALYDFYNKQPTNSNKISFIDDVNIRNNEVATIITLLEWIYNPGTGSVIEYKNGEAIRKAKEKEMNVVKEYIMPMQEGMFEGAILINEYMKYHPYEACETKKYVYETLKKIKTKPSKELTKAYYSMVFNDTFGTDTYVEKEGRLSFWKKLNIIKCRNMLRNEQWREAFLVYNDMWYMKIILNIKSILRKLRKG